MLQPTVTVLSGKELIQCDAFHPIVQQLNELSGVPPEHFQLLYKAPIERFLALTQFSNSPTPISHLHATVKSLKLRRSLILPLDSDAESINKQKDLWTYAIFVSALMHQSHRLLGYQVLYKESATSPARQWSPFNAPLPTGSQYRIVGEKPLSQYSAITILPLIFCPQCLSWLYQNVQVFNTTLELIHAPASIPRIGYLITDTHTKNSQKPNNTPQKQPESKTAPAKNEAPLTIPAQKTPPFRHWLRKLIAEDHPGYILSTVNGYAIADPDIFHYYCEQHTLEVPKEERKRFLNLEIHEESPKIKLSNGAVKKAFLIRDPSTL